MRFTALPLNGTGEVVPDGGTGVLVRRAVRLAPGGAPGVGVAVGEVGGEAVLAQDAAVGVGGCREGGTYVWSRDSLFVG